MFTLLIVMSIALVMNLPVILASTLSAGKPGALGLVGTFVAVAALWGIYFATRPKPPRATFTPPTLGRSLLAPSYPLPGMTFGNPGGIASASSRFGVEQVKAGVRGEHSTARLLDLLLEIPGVNVFHGLRFPGSSTADVDHAVVHGDTVFLIDSKQYGPGTYSWGHGPEIVNSATGTEYPNHMAAARAGYEQILGRGVRVHAMVIIHGDKASIGPRGAQNGVRLADPQWALALLGDALATGHREGWSEFDNSEIVGRLLANLK